MKQTILQDLSVGAYVVRTSSLNDKLSCQLFRMGLREKTTTTYTVKNEVFVYSHLKVF